MYFRILVSQRLLSTVEHLLVKTFVKHLNTLENVSVDYNTSNTLQYELYLSNTPHLGTRDS